MKILHLTKKFPNAIGGDAVVVSQLRAQQIKAGHKVIIVTSNCDDIKPARHLYKIGLRDTSEKLDVITIRRLVSLVLLFFQMFAILRKERPDVIHTHSIDMAFVASYAARRYHIPILHTFHIVTFYDKNQSVVRRKTELWFARRVQPRQVTAPNKYDVDKLQATGISKARLLPNGVDTTFWNRRHDSDKKNDATFVAVGRLEDQKGYEFLIKAIVFLTDIPNLRVIIVGDGSRRASLQALIKKLYLEDIVTLTGQKSPSQIRVLLAKSHAAIFPSLYETTPLTLLEAWAVGIPVIATQVGILRSVPNDFRAAVVVPSKDEEALAVAMRQSLEDDGFAKIIGTEGAKEATKYEWPIIAQTAESLYRDIR